MPAAQAVQLWAPLEDHTPAGQVMHALTEVLPLVGLYVPAAQAVHALAEVLPLLGLYLPTAQAAQALAPATEYIPAMHVV